MNRRHLAKAATVAVAVVIILLAGRNCENELADVTIAFDRGGGPAIEAISAELFRPGEEAAVARFERRVVPGATGTLARWSLQIDPGSYELAVEVDPVDGPPARDRRSVEARARATISIDLSKSLPGDR